MDSELLMYIGAFKSIFDNKNISNIHKSPLFTPHFESYNYNQILTAMQKHIGMSDIWNNIISVGSGAGDLENYMECEQNIKLICVDPLDGYVDINTIVRKPDFTNITQLIQNCPKYISNSILLLIWPYDNSRMGYNKYDIDAINHLCPTYIVLLYEKYGAAGSDDLHAWISKQTDYCIIDRTKKRYGEKHSFLHLNEKCFILTIFKKI